jgi:hypothetical protein
MKILVFLYLVITLYFNVHTTFADDSTHTQTEPLDKNNPTCDECTCLIPHKYPQEVCNDKGEKPVTEIMCVDFPLIGGLSAYNSAGNYFLKFNKNLCFDYDHGSFPFTQNRILSNDYRDIIPFIKISAKSDTVINGVAEEFEYTIFDTASIVNMSGGSKPSILDSVFHRWKENCPETKDDPVKGSGTSCCIKVKWTTRVVDMGGIREAESAAARVNTANHFNEGLKNSNDCNDVDVGCNLIIFINATRNRIVPKHPTNPGATSQLRPSWFFFTDSIPAPKDAESGFDYRTQFQYVSLEDVLLHEVGHLLGMGHYDSKPGCEDKTVPASESIMAGKVKPNEKHGLSWKDRCAYKRANCCQGGNGSQYLTLSNACPITSKQEYINKIQALSFPNPADQWVFVPTTVEGSYSVEIYDYVGRQYFNGTLDSFDSKIGIPVGHLTNGNYVIRVTMSKNIQDFSIVISR